MLIHQKGMVLEDINLFKENYPQMESEVLVIDNEDNNISLIRKPENKKRLKFRLGVAYFITLTLMITILLLS